MNTVSMIFQLKTRMIPEAEGYRKLASYSCCITGATCSVQAGVGAGEDRFKVLLKVHSYFKMFLEHSLWAGNRWVARLVKAGEEEWGQWKLRLCEDRKMTVGFKDFIIFMLHQRLSFIKCGEEIKLQGAGKGHVWKHILSNSGTFGCSER